MKIGPLMKRNERRWPGLSSKHLGPDDVRRHEVGSELDALGLEAEDLAERLDEERLGEARNADQQRMAAREQRDQRMLDDDILAEDDGGGCLVGALHALGGGLEPRDDRFVGLG